VDENNFIIFKILPKKLKLATAVEVLRYKEQHSKFVTEGSEERAVYIL
jgi:hypothetical protein